MRIALHAWYNAWRAVHAETNLIFVSKDRHGPFLPQVHFVRDELAKLVWTGAELHPTKDCVVVIGEHTSKSVRLPVYSLERPDLGLRIVLRYNYFDWKLSVISDDPIKSALFPFLFHTTSPIAPDFTGNELDDCYFEGFPKELVFGYHVDNKRRWSASLDERALWTTVFECMRSLGVLKPHVWHTRKSHLALLDAERKS
jgi:hypothetical protein